MLVRDIGAVTRRRLATIGTEAALARAAKMLSDTPVSLLVVCEADGTMAGVLTKTDLVRTFGERPESAASATSADVMTRDVVSCRPDDDLEGVLRTMSKHRHVHLPVLDTDARPSGVMEARDALRALVEHANFEVEHLRDYIMGVGYQ